MGLVQGRKLSLSLTCDCNAILLNAANSLTSVPKKPPSASTSIIPAELIEQKIYVIRGHKVMLDRDLAQLYAVQTIALRQQVKRNPDRFPDDFIFQLTKKEADLLVSQNVIPSRRSLGGSLPYAFTEQGVAMLSSVLKSKRAAQVNVIIIRTFVRLRELLSTHKDIAQRLDDLEQKYDQQFQVVFEAIRQLLAPEEVPPKRRIGFYDRDTEKAEDDS